MRDDLIRGATSSTVALLRRAMMFHRANATPEGARAGAPREKTPTGRSCQGARQSLTERQLQVLGVPQPPDRAETGVPGFRW